MVNVHVLDLMTDMNGAVLPKVVEFLGCPPAAGVFMFAMGVGMVYTKHNTPKEFALRGVKLLLMGYVLNFFRETLLILIGNSFGIENSYEDISLFSTLYILQWLVITYTIAVMEIMQIELFPVQWGIPIGLVVTGGGIGLCELWNLWKAKRKQKKG